MLSYTISMMCMNNIKNNMKYTNTLCRTLLCVFLLTGAIPERHILF